MQSCSDPNQGWQLSSVVQPRRVSRCRPGCADFRIFLDDFGMDYAGLSYLAGLDFDGIKIELVSAFGSTLFQGYDVAKPIKLSDTVSWTHAFAA